MSFPRALQHYDPSGKGSFTRLARSQARRDVQHEAIKSGTIVSTPREEVEFMRKLELTRQRLNRRMGEDPTPGQIAKEMGVKLTDLLTRVGGYYQPKRVTLDDLIQFQAEQLAGGTRAFNPARFGKMEK